MREQPSVYVLATEDYRRIEVMLAGLSRTIEALFDRRLVVTFLGVSRQSTASSGSKEVWHLYRDGCTN